MFDILGMVAALNRPGLLVRTARYGLDDYRREVHLPRLLATNAPVKNGDALLRLMDIERELNDQRVADHAEYSFARHIDILIAIMGETRLLRAGHAPRVQ